MNFYIVIKGLLILCIITIVSGDHEPQKCCRNEKNLLINRRCAPDLTGKKPSIVLKCDEKYILNPYDIEEDSYNVTENGTLFIPDMNNYLFWDEYCLVDTYDEDNNETYEIAIVCFPEVQPDILKLPFTIKAILIFISVIFLLLTIYIYIQLPELRQTQDKVTILTLACLTMFLMFLGALQVYTPSMSKYDLCLFLAYPTYFFTMAYFSWLNCVIANVWKLIVTRGWKIAESMWYLLNSIYAWFIPVLLTGIIVIKHSLKPSLGVESCWFHEIDDQILLVYLPITVMIAINIVLCISTSINLSKRDYTPSTLKNLKSKYILYLKLFLLGGLTWIFEVLSFKFNDHSPTQWLWIIVDSINCLHGVLVFCVLIVWRQRIRKEMYEHKLFGIEWPSTWANIDTHEEEICLENEGNKNCLTYSSNI